MAIALTVQNTQNSSVKTDQFSPGASGASVMQVRACLDLATVPAMPIYLQMFDQASAPSSGNAPVMSVPFSSAGFAELDFGLGGRKFSNVAYFTLSTTPHTYTWAGKVGGGNLQALFDAQYL